MEQFKSIIDKHRSDLAFVIGNGLNHHSSSNTILSWEDLLGKLWYKVTNKAIDVKPEGLSITEYYDLLEIENKGKLNLQKEVVELMANWEPTRHHEKIVGFIRELDSQVLTTNFDETLATAGNCILHKIEASSFSDFYPWNTYFGLRELNLPTTGFGIWHINGMTTYPRSIRLGLSHYMGSVEKARTLIHDGNDETLFTGKNVSNWNGHTTWLHIIFNKTLIIFGLALDENETYLRWLLIQRVKYFKEYPERTHSGYYLKVTSGSPLLVGKKMFLESVGIKIIEINSRKALYEDLWE